MLLLNILLICLSIIILLILAVLIAPLPYQVSLQLDGNSYGARIKFLWLAAFSYTSDDHAPRLTLAGRQLQFKSNSGKERPREARSRKPAQSTLNDLRTWLDRRLLGRGWDFFKLTMAQILPQKLIIRGKVGLDDPFYTGLLFIILPFLGRIPRSQVNIDPVWDACEQHIHLEASGRIILVIIIFHGLKFFFSEPMRRARRKKKAYQRPVCNPSPGHGV